MTYSDFAVVKFQHRRLHFDPFAIASSACFESTIKQQPKSNPYAQPHCFNRIDRLSLTLTRQSLYRMLITSCLPWMVK